MEIITKKFESEPRFVYVQLGLEGDDSGDVVLGDVELDIENQAKFVDVINGIFTDDMYNVLVDLKLVSYIDSSGLWALFEGHKKASQKNGNLVLLNPTKDVKRVLDITKVSSKMRVYGDYDEAVRSFIN
ncbi:MAG: STAS domain-containing protein [bacterium]